MQDDEAAAEFSTSVAPAETGGAAERPDADALELSIVMPCLNEAETLETCVEKARRFLSDYQVAGEIVVADNGSTDGSPQIAERLGARVVHVPEKGYGAALMGGITAARGRYVVMGDADDSYDFLQLGPFLDALREGYDLVMGNRFAGGIEPGAMPWLHRYIGNPVLSMIGKVFFKSPVNDFHCGIRGFSRAAVMKLDLRTARMEFASEMVVKATLHKMRIAEVPTTLSPDGRSRPPHLRTWRDGWRHLRFMLLYSPRWLFLYPGILLMVLGLLTGLWLLPGARYVGPVSFDVHTLLYAALMILVGFQAVVFSILTKVFAINEGLLPVDPRLNRLLHFFKLEGGLVAGGLLLVVGLLGTILALRDWSLTTFGVLDPTVVLRLVIPAVLFLVLGCEVILASFFLSVLRLHRRHTVLNEDD
jgi:glycosyltransferase involved in cell wall biosynthesis